MRLNFSLRSRMTIVSVGLVLVATLASLTASWLSTRDSLRSSVAEKLQLAGDLKEIDLQNWIASTKDDAVFLSRNPYCQQILADYFHSGDDRPVRHLFHDTLALKPKFKDIFLVKNPGGRVMVSTTPAQEIVYLNQSEIFLEGRKRLISTSIYPWPLTLEPTLSIGLPFPEYSAAPLGILTFNLELSGLDDFVRMGRQLGRSGEIFLVNKYGELVSNYRQGQQDFPRGLNSVGVQRAIAKLPGADAYLNHRGVMVFGNYRWIEELEVGLVVEVTEGEALASANGLGQFNLVIGLIILLLSALASLALTANLVRPLRALTEASKQITEQDWDVHLNLKRQDEIGILSRSFQTMATNLRAVITELEDRNAELERYTYSVSHDLKSPLITIKGFLGYLRNDLAAANPARVESDIQRIERAADKMHDLLNDLLDFSRAGKKDLKKAPLSLEVPFHLALESLAAVVDPESLEVSGLPWPVVPVEVDKLVEVWRNLLENCAKYQQPGRPLQVTIRCQVEDQRAVFTVRDNGIGFPPEYQTKVFGLFEKLNPNTEGSGLGLALVKRIIELHGGRIRAESAGIGQGALFEFWLPL